MSLYNFSTNLKNLRLSKNLTQKQLSDVLNVSRQTISNYENATNEPDFYMIAKIANYFNCSIDSLVFGGLNTSLQTIDNLLDINKLLINKDTLTKQLLDNKTILYKNIEEIDKILSILDTLNSTNIEVSEELTPSNIINFNEYKDNHSINVDFYKSNNVKISRAYFNQLSDDTVKKFPVYGNISCGALKLTDDSIEDYFYIDKNSLKYNDNDYFILRVDGDSMNKLYKNGDYLLIRKTQSFDSHNQPYVFMVDDEATLKFISIDEDNLKLIPHSTKDCYDIKNITFDELKYMNSSIIGTVESVLDFQD